MKARNLPLVGLLVLVLAGVFPVLAQSDRGAITGRVTDQNGAVVTNAKVTAANLETNEVREVTTNDEGNFSIPQLQAASYTLKVEAAGFKTASIEGVRIAVQITRTVDVTLEVGAIGDTVMVSAESFAHWTAEPVARPRSADW